MIWAILMHQILLIAGLALARASIDYRCRENVPDALSFVEPLWATLTPSDIVIFTGGDSFERRISGFANLSANSIAALADHHGYGLQFLDELNYNWRLKHNGHQFSGHWHRVFAMPALRRAYPDARYFVWMDDDILVPYPETDMLNHYVNMMEAERGIQMMFASEAEQYVLNSGMFFMRNSNFSFWAYEEALKIGCENNGYLSWHFGHEQTSIAEVRHRYKLQHQIRVLPHRVGPYNFNTFARWARHDTPDMIVQQGDAFAHFLGGNAAAKLKRMQDWLKPIDAWRGGVLEICEFPIDIHK